MLPLTKAPKTGISPPLKGELIWTRFKKQKAAMVGAWVLVILILSGIFAPFLTPYDPTIAGRDKDYLNGAPTIPQFCDYNGCSIRAFIYALERERSAQTNFRSEEHTSELQSLTNLVCRLLLEKKKKKTTKDNDRHVKQKEQ